MEYAPPDVVHYYSERTRVSLELPAGWVEIDAGDRHEIYAPEGSDDDDGGWVTPRLVVKVVDSLFTDPETYLKLSQQLRDSMEDAESVGRETLEVDGFDGVEDVFRYSEPSVNRRVTQLQVFVQVGQAVFSLTGVVDAKAEADALGAFRDAVASIRFIMTWPQEP